MRRIVDMIDSHAAMVIPIVQRKLRSILVSIF